MNKNKLERKEYNTYTAEDKINALKIYEDNNNQNQTAIDCDISRSALRYWIDLYKTSDNVNTLDNSKIISYRNMKKIYEVGEHLEQGSQYIIEDLYEDYAYMLGVYLGDGSIDNTGKTYKIRLFQDSKYPNLVNKWTEVLQHILPNNKVSNHQHYKHNCRIIIGHSNLLPLIFPQHGPGKKHSRKIELSPWQEKITLSYPEEFLKGLMDSDGCLSRHIDTRSKKNYPKYLFSQKSLDIKQMFMDYCDLLGIHYTLSCEQQRQVAICRREDVAKMGKFIEIKS